MISSIGIFYAKLVKLTPFISLFIGNKTMNNTIKSAINTLPTRTADLLKAYAVSQPLSYLPAEFVNDLREQQPIELFGLSLLPLAAAFAVTPLSHFNVGAVAFDSEGNAYLGANFEFSGVAINQTIHAEQSAIANAWAHGAKDLALLVINYAPCGHCRQFINEVNLAAHFLIQLPESVAQPLSYYLPDAFGPNDLGIDTRILRRSPPMRPSDNELSSAATAACLASHAPYSGSASGIALRYPNDEMVVGCYGENAAFNPSLAPLQMALNTRRLQGKRWQSVSQAMLIESSPAVTQRHQTEQLLATFSTTKLDYLII